MSTKAAPQIPDDARDWVGSDLILRDQIISTVVEVLKRHGGVPMDTPALEPGSPPTEGDDGKDGRLALNLDNEGGFLQSDLTAPFARWLAMNPYINHMKRYQIGKTYRRERGKHGKHKRKLMVKEGYQCQFDIAGKYDAMIPEAEILRIVSEVCHALALDVTIRVNHARILNGILTVAGVPDGKIREVGLAVGKLDECWERWGNMVRKEIVRKHGMDEEVADRIRHYVLRKGGVKDMIELLEHDSELVGNDDVRAGLREMELLTTYLRVLGVDNVSFDFSLARHGLEHCYSGLTYDVALRLPCPAEPPANNRPRKKSKPIAGSVATGGRHDNLAQGCKRDAIPSASVSFDINHMFDLLSAARSTETTTGSNVLRNEVDVYIMAFGGDSGNGNRTGFSRGFLLERMAIARQLWDAGIRAEYWPKAELGSPFSQVKNAVKRAVKSGARLLVILGREEHNHNDSVRLQILGRTVEEKRRDKRNHRWLVPRQNVVEEVKKMLLQMDRPQAEGAGKPGKSGRG
ncbi:hypothetical protein QBC46DRAFT_417196 [Diplogelasinospora grovesii]|uniref:histidine--tRNA ligase n=1 Tax=Diplogelasinospora grovesii TaxID=303347 RepID=A0AAN6N2E1_9PEZI|nr:hypothetical protein QBC46DRAFT_417196 [Diplogelasinospora grovesii]